jgi:hypothetical protein
LILGVMKECLSYMFPAIYYMPWRETLDAETWP